MTAHKIQTATLPRHHYKDYQKKASEFLSVMQICLNDGQWDAAVLNGVHAAISITDALLVFRSGIRSISQKHDDAVTLLHQYIPSKKLGGQDVRLSRILNLKSIVSYQPVVMSESKARQFAKDVERYFEWASKLLV